jgi:TetR/AcrR family transcriptional regulator, ethionamide resistance regulator
MGPTGTRRSRRHSPERRDVAGSILDAAEALLAERGLADLTVADVIESAGVSRGSFYFYFESKQAVVAALLERIVEEVHEAALPWFERGETPPEPALRAAIGGSLALWRRHAAVLRSTVESWQSDPGIRELWGEVIDRFTRAAAAQIERDREAGVAPEGPPADALAGALVAMNERSFYFAVVGTDPGSDTRLEEALTHIWLSAIYGDRPVAAIG